MYFYLRDRESSTITATVLNILSIIQFDNSAFFFFNYIIGFKGGAINSSCCKGGIGVANPGGTSSKKVTL